VKPPWLPQRPLLEIGAEDGFEGGAEDAVGVADRDGVGVGARVDETEPLPHVPYAGSQLVPQ
jgi:hypothetical protein